MLSFIVKKLNILILLFMIRFLFLTQRQTSAQTVLPRIPCVIFQDTINETAFNATWNLEERACASYNVILYAGYSVNEIGKIERFTGNSLQFTHLSPSSVYGVRVQCVGQNEEFGALGIPCRAKTSMGQVMTTRAVTVGIRPTPPQGDCGSGFFSCDGFCLPNYVWCDGTRDCSENEDERNCTQLCPSFTFPDTNGNHSCRIHSNDFIQVCFFECNEEGGYQRDGPWYSACINGNWSRGIPTCKQFIMDVMVQREPNTAILTILVHFLVDSIELKEVVDDSGQVIDVETLDFAIEEVYGASDSTVNYVYAVYNLSRGRTYTASLVPIDSSENGGIPKKIEFCKM